MAYPNSFGSNPRSGAHLNLSSGYRLDPPDWRYDPYLTRSRSPEAFESTRVPPRQRECSEEFYSSYGPEHTPRGISHPRSQPQVANNLTCKVKSKFPYFGGCLDPKVFLDWVEDVEQFFLRNRISDDQKTYFAKMLLTGSAGTHWQQTLASQKEEPIDSWAKMKRKLKEKYAPKISLTLEEEFPYRTQPKPSRSHVPPPETKPPSQSIPVCTWKYTPSFRTYYMCNRLICKVEILRSSCRNVISRRTLTWFSLDPKPLPDPYFLEGLSQETVYVHQRCLVPLHFSTYRGYTWCDVIPVDDFDVLLGSPWLTERKVTYLCETNSYVFSHQGKSILIEPYLAKPSSIDLDTRALVPSDILTDPIALVSTPAFPVAAVESDEPTVPDVTSEKSTSRPTPVLGTWIALTLTPRMTLFILIRNATHLAVVVHFRSFPLLGLGFPIIRPYFFRGHFLRLPLRINFRLSIKRILDEIDTDTLDSYPLGLSARHLRSHLNIQIDSYFRPLVYMPLIKDLTVHHRHLLQSRSHLSPHLDSYIRQMPLLEVFPTLPDPSKTVQLFRVNLQGLTLRDHGLIVNPLPFPLHGHRSYSHTHQADNTRGFKTHVFTHLSISHPPWISLGSL